jgi:PIN domain nuclease of toxin-antitoxin system
MASEHTYLLDTQIALWIMLGVENTALKRIKELCSISDTDFIFHQTSTWEIQIKYSLGKLLLPERPENFLIESVKDSGFKYNQIEDQAIFMLDKLPLAHSDPFDRLLISHAVCNNWTILTTDNKFGEYPVKSKILN